VVVCYVAAKYQPAAAAAAADWVFVMWLDTVTYLHHHGPEDAAMKMPWYR
jgi:hypothetical protein